MNATEIIRSEVLQGKSFDKESCHCIHEDECDQSLINCSLNTLVDSGEPAWPTELQKEAS